MTDRKQNVEQAKQYIQEALRLIQENKSDIDTEVTYMKDLARDSDQFRALSEWYECHAGAEEGLNKALFNLLDIVW